MMGFFRTGTGSKLVKQTAAPEPAADIPVVTDTVEEDVTYTQAQQQRQRNGLRSTLVSNGSQRGSRLLEDTPQGNTTLG